jgi:hypothetical protein
MSTEIDYDAEIMAAQAELHAAQAPGADPGGRPRAYKRMQDAKAAKQKAQREAERDKLVAKYMPYPLGALGVTLGDAAMGLARKIKCPPAIAANSMLACASVAAQAVANVRMNYGALKPLSLDLVTVAESGDRKTTADDHAKKPLERKQAALRKAYKKLKEEYDNARLAWDAERAAIIKREKTFAARKDALAKLGPAPIKPPGPKLVISDGTAEGIAKAFRTLQQALGLLNSEGGMFVSGHGFSDDNKVKTAAVLSNLWDGAPIDRALAGDGLVEIVGVRLAVHMMVQPDIAKEFLSDPALTNQGLLARFLIAWPESLAGSRIEGDDPQLEGCDDFIEVYEKKLGALLAAGRAQPDGALDLRTLRLGASANEIRRDYQNQVERAVGVGGRYFPVRATANKTAEQACRIAGVLTLFDNPGAMEIDADTMNRACRLAKWYLNEALRIGDISSKGREINDGRLLLDWVKKRPEDATGGWTVPMREIQNSGPYVLRKSKEGREAAVNSLESVGLAIWRGSLGNAKSKFFVPRGASL